MSQCQEQVQTDNFCSQQQIVILHSLNAWVSTDNLSAVKAKSFFVHMRLMPLIPAGTQLCTEGLAWPCWVGIKQSGRQKHISVFMSEGEDDRFGVAVQRWSRDQLRYPRVRKLAQQCRNVSVALLFVAIIFAECMKIVINMHFRHFAFVLGNFRLAGLLWMHAGWITMKAFSSNTLY